MRGGSTAFQPCTSQPSAAHTATSHAMAHPSCQVSMPERVSTHEYYVQQLPGRPHPCYMRRPTAPAGAGPGPGALPAGPSSSPSPGGAMPHPSATTPSRSSSRGPVGAAAGDEVVLDLNELAAVHGEHVQVGQVRRGGVEGHARAPLGRARLAKGAGDERAASLATAPAPFALVLQPIPLPHPDWLA